MRKLILSLLLGIMLVTPAMAQETTQEVAQEEKTSFSMVDLVKKLPSLKQGVMYNLDQNELDYIFTTPIAKLKWFDVEIGYSDHNSLVGVLSYNLFDAKEKGVELPILDLLEVNLGVGAGVNRIGSGGGNNEFTWGLTATLIDLNF